MTPVIAHVVLFQPKAALTEDQRRTFVSTLQAALVGIPTIKRAHVGRRRTFGRFYDAQNAHDFSFIAILEFEDEAELLAYLEHPAHRSLGEQFYLTAERALAFDFELLEGDRAQDVLTAENLRF